MAEIRRQLLPRIAALLPEAREARARGTVAPRRPAQPPRSVHRASGPPGRVDVVAIGVSTGGPTALAELIPALPPTLPVPVLIVQHMPPMFTKILAERLDHKSAVRVVEGADGARIDPGTVVVAPGDRHMEVASREHLRIYDGPHENSCRPSVDPLFRSVATHFGSHTLAVVLTGMGRDGLRGAEEVAVAGGHILVQDEASSVVWGMPGFVSRAGLADAAMPLDGLAAEIVRRLGVGRDAAMVAGASS